MGGRGLPAGMDGTVLRGRLVFLRSSGGRLRRRRVGEESKSFLHLETKARQQLIGQKLLL